MREPSFDELTPREALRYGVAVFAVATDMLFSVSAFASGAAVAALVSLVALGLACVVNARVLQVALRDAKVDGPRVHAHFMEWLPVLSLCIVSSAFLDRLPFRSAPVHAGLPTRALLIASLLGPTFGDVAQLFVQVPFVALASRPQPLAALSIFATAAAIAERVFANGRTVLRGAAADESDRKLRARVPARGGGGGEGEHGNDSADARELGLPGRPRLTLKSAPARPKPTPAPDGGARTLARDVDGAERAELHACDRAARAHERIYDHAAAPPMPVAHAAVRGDAQTADADVVVLSRPRAHGMCREKSAAAVTAVGCASALARAPSGLSAVTVECGEGEGGGGECSGSGGGGGVGGARVLAAGRAGAAAAVGGAAAGTAATSTASASAAGAGAAALVTSAAGAAAWTVPSYDGDANTDGRPRTLVPRVHTRTAPPAAKPQLTAPPPRAPSAASADAARARAKGALDATPPRAPPKAAPSTAAPAATGAARARSSAAPQRHATGASPAAARVTAPSRAVAAASAAAVAAATPVVVTVEAPATEACAVIECCEDGAWGGGADVGGARERLLAQPVATRAAAAAASERLSVALARAEAVTVDLSARSAERHSLSPPRSAAEESGWAAAVHLHAPAAAQPLADALARAAFVTEQLRARSTAHGCADEQGAPTGADVPACGAAAHTSRSCAPPSQRAVTARGGQSAAASLARARSPAQSARRPAASMAASASGVGAAASARLSAPAPAKQPRATSPAPVARAASTSPAARARAPASRSPAPSPGRAAARPLPTTMPIYASFMAPTGTVRARAPAAPAAPAVPARTAFAFGGAGPRFPACAAQPEPAAPAHGAHSNAGPTLASMALRVDPSVAWAGTQARAARAKEAEARKRAEKEAHRQEAARVRAARAAEAHAARGAADERMGERSVDVAARRDEARRTSVPASAVGRRAAAPAARSVSPARAPPTPAHAKTGAAQTVVGALVRPAPARHAATADRIELELSSAETATFEAFGAPDADVTEPPLPPLNASQKAELRVELAADTQPARAPSAVITLDDAEKEARLARVEAQLEKLALKAKMPVSLLHTAEQLDFTDAGLTDEMSSAIVVLVQVNDALEELHLSSNGLTDVTGVALAVALESNGSVTQLSLDANELTDATAIALGATLQRNGALSGIDLGANRIGDAGAAALAEGLRGNSTVRDLWLNNNALTMHSAKPLARALADPNCALEKLNLNYNQLGDLGADALAKALQLNESLRTLSLDGNGISDVGAAPLARALHTNATLAELWLEDNRCGDVAAMHLGRALKANVGLAELYLWGNQVGDAGAFMLARGLAANGVLQALRLRDNMLTAGGVRAIEKAWYTKGKQEPNLEL
ncbi:hypothetical protein KFE25_007593 [Diacronema lutheri]|uniref:Uncharacterized protein n=1 Tax=Diacronema lutheri TaxID=2081491 RepID=A0A8J5Y0L2_DIALT|nr:hypothetical protein KFE25_007593 [Diacronema lutheri]